MAAAPAQAPQRRHGSMRGCGQGNLRKRGYAHIAELNGPPLLELLGESGVHGFEQVRAVAGQHHSPQMPWVAHGHGVVAAAAAERTVGAFSDGPVSLAWIEGQLRIVAARQLTVGVE